MKHPILDMGAIGLFVLSFFQVVSPLIAVIGSTLGAMYYGMLIYDRIKYGKNDNAK